MIQTSMQPARPEQGARQAWLGLERVRLYSAAFLVLFVLLLATWAWHSKGFTDSNVTRPGVDFSVFWSASYLALSEGPVHAYDIAKHLEVMREYGAQGVGSETVLPWLYPPTFLLMVLPLALLPLAFSYVLFVFGSGYAYLCTVSCLLNAGAPARSGWWVPVVSAPAVLLAAILGQNSLLTAALAGSAVGQLGKRPVLAGVLVGLLAIKPQLALLLPVAMAAGRHWRALMSAAATAALFFATSVAVCGWETIPAFLQSLAWARENLIEGTIQGWYGMPSVLSAAQLAGLRPTAAYAAQALCGLGAVLAVAYVWSHTIETPLRAAVLAAATLLAAPYVRHYELTWMGIAVAGLIADGLRHGLSSKERLLFVAVWLLPLFEHANPQLQMPQIGPLLSALLVIDVMWRVMSRPAVPTAPATVRD
ncbi:glycosyltransferase family 87 protein [Cupriavidus sp. Agwp_2]|uniref:glycosyltransferase family 87 protein n=1 Tax=Cupriavidus sp. Agwp_2 TaxID=2897324 RepID=UPI003460539B